MKRWDRLLGIYELAERVRSAEAGRARMALAEAEAMGEKRRQEVVSALGVGRSEGGAEWAMAQLTREFALREMRRLAQVREMRVEALLVAAAEHRESLVEMEQMRAVREAAEASEAVERERRTQGLSDDRFAARQWLRVVGEEPR